MHPYRENIFPLSPEEGRTMVRKLLVELERLWPRDDDSSERPIDEHAPVFGTIENSGRRGETRIPSSLRNQSKI
jgi:hypothetical protein